jgi:hypothetical protein
MANNYSLSMAKILLLVIFFTGLLFRLHGLNWDQGQHLHPDERFLTMVANDMRWQSPRSYFDTTTSTLNPHNLNYSFYVYGTFPVMVVKFASNLLSFADYGHINLVGRVISALLDSVVIVVIYFLALRITSSSRTALISSCFYSLSVLPIQLSHFYASDPFLNFFLLLTLLFLFIGLSRHIAILPAGFFMGLAISSKLSAVIFVPIILLGLLGAFYNSLRANTLKQFFSICLLSLFICFLTVRIAYPYLFVGWHLNPKVVANINQLKSFDDPKGYFPPAVQWVTTKPLLFPLANMFYWGLGIPLAICSVMGLFFVGHHIFLSKNFRYLLLISWPILLFFYQGTQFVKALRYFYPIYPALCILAAIFVSKVNTRLQILTIVLISLWPLSFLNIYNTSHPRIAASVWIYDNIPAGTSISCEHWDDCLPLNLPKYPGNGSYKGIEFPLYNPDSKEKWQLMAKKLSSVEYVILSSNRLYGSIPSSYPKYLQTPTFYTKLFSGELGFTKVAEFASRPGFRIPFINLCITPPGSTYGLVSASSHCVSNGLSIIDDYADETFTVYDHPKVTIFKKTGPIPDLTQLF